MPPKKIHCEVRGCDQRSKGIDISTLTFHRFPLEINDAEQWSLFAGSAYAQDQFKRWGPVGVRKLWMCSQHFEPNSYKIPETKTSLRHGILPTLNGPSDEPEDDEEVAIVGVSEAVEKGNEVGEVAKDRILPAAATTAAVVDQAQSARNMKRKHIDDRFYDFLLDTNDDGNAPAKSSRPTRKPHAPFCVCSVCRTTRAAKAMKKGSTPSKAIQTADSGPQPDASPVPMGTTQDSCRLCFNTDQLEPLCSGMIVVRDEMLDKIYVCTGILIIPRPKVSIFICTPCAQLINSFHAYRQQVCSNNQALLRAIALKAAGSTKSVGTPKSVPKVQKVSPLPPSQVRKRFGNAPGVPVPVPIKRKPPVGLIPVIETTPPTMYRKILPKLPMVVQPEVTVAQPVKEEVDDPLEGCGETTQKVMDPPVAKKSNVLIQIPQPMIETKKEAVPMPTQLTMDVEEDEHEDLPEGEQWKCWNCENSFSFQFECAKHLLLVHEESVGTIKKRLKLDELNANMLQMMSMNQKKAIVLE